MDDQSMRRVGEVIKEGEGVYIFLIYCFGIIALGINPLPLWVVLCGIVVEVILCALLFVKLVKGMVVQAKYKNFIHIHALHIGRIKAALVTLPPGFCALIAGFIAMAQTASPYDYRYIPAGIYCSLVIFTHCFFSMSRTPGLHVYKYPATESLDEMTPEERKILSRIYGIKIY